MTFLLTMELKYNSMYYCCVNMRKRKKKDLFSMYI